MSTDPADLARGLAALAPRLTPGATTIEGVKRLSGGASQETWSFDVPTPDGPIGFILRRPPGGAEAMVSAQAIGLEKEAGTNPRIGLVVADTLANLGQHEKAVGFYQKLVGNAAVDQDTVNLRMGAAMLKMGNKDGAKAAFAAVKAGPRAQIAQFYGVLAGA